MDIIQRRMHYHDGQFDAEGRALAFAGALGTDIAAMKLDQVFDYR